MFFVLVVVLLLGVGLLTGLKLLGVLALSWSAVAMVFWLPLAAIGAILAPPAIVYGIVLLVQKFNGRKAE